MNLYRSLLYVPADNAPRVAKALNSAADVTILDLEDAVAVSRKEAARKDLKVLLSGKRQTQAYVRVNAMSTPFCLEDIEAAIEAGVDGISLPKVESPEDLFAVDWVMSSIEKRLAKPDGSVALLPVVESGKGLLNAQTSLARVARVKRAGLGVGDLALELSLILSSDQREVVAYRQMLVLASNAAGLESPLDTVFLDLNDLDGLRQSCIESRKNGFQGRRIIHPSQIDIVNEVYSPSQEEVAAAEKIVAEFYKAERDGLASIRVGNVFVDYPIAYKSQKILEKRDAIAASAARRRPEGVQ